MYEPGEKKIQGRQVSLFHHHTKTAIQEQSTSQEQRITIVQNKALKQHSGTTTTQELLKQYTN